MHLLWLTWHTEGLRLTQVPTAPTSSLLAARSFIQSFHVTVSQTQSVTLWNKWNWWCCATMHCVVLWLLSVSSCSSDTSGVDDLPYNEILTVTLWHKWHWRFVIVTQVKLVLFHAVKSVQSVTVIVGIRSWTPVPKSVTLYGAANRRQYNTDFHPQGRQYGLQ